MTPNEKHVEILAEEIILQESTYVERDDIKNDLLNDVQFELYPATIFTAMQTLQEELDAAHSKDIENIVETLRKYEATIAQLREEANKLRLELRKVNEVNFKPWSEGFTEGYNMAIEDIREGNPLNKVAK